MNRMNLMAGAMCYFLLSTDFTDFTDFSLSLIRWLPFNLCNLCNLLTTTLNMFSAGKDTMFPLPRADIPNLPVPHHVRCA